MDFVTGLPPSSGNTTILTVVDRFSKMAHFVALPKLPTAKETAAAFLNNIVRIHGIPKDIVSDRGPQFTSRFWKEFCTLLGASVSLTSGYHPQSNGQTERLNRELDSEKEVVVPSTHALLRRCHRVWSAARQTLQRSAGRMKVVADRRRRDAPGYRPGQRVCLSSKDPPSRSQEARPTVRRSISHNQDH